MARQFCISAFIALTILPIAYIAAIFSELQSMTSDSSPQNFWATIIIPATVLISGWLVVGGRHAFKKPEQPSRNIAKGANIMAGFTLAICALGTLGG